MLTDLGLIINNYHFLPVQHWLLLHTWIPKWLSNAGKGHLSIWWLGVWQGFLPTGLWNMESRQRGSSCALYSSGHHRPMLHRRKIFHLGDVWTMQPCWSGNRSISNKTADPFFYKKYIIIIIWTFWSQKDCHDETRRTDTVPNGYRHFSVKLA